MPDTNFSQKEKDYLGLQRLARIATASSRGEGSIQPDVVPVGFDFDGESSQIHQIQECPEKS